MVSLSSLVGGTMKMLPKRFLKHFVFDRTISSKDPYFPNIMFIYKTNENTNILDQDVQNEDVYLLDFFLNS